MSSLRLPLVAACVAAGWAWAQSPLTFEVASVRVAKVMPPNVRLPMVGDVTGGPGTDDPTRIDYTWVRPERLLMEAFGIPLDQIVAPESLETKRYNILAEAAAGATKEQVQQMLLNLLKERFHLAYHREKRDFDLYTLVVAKGGPKLKDAAPADGPLPAPLTGADRFAAAGTDRDGFPNLPAGGTASLGKVDGGVMRMTFRMSTPAALLRMLRSFLGGAKMEDRTGLTGLYDFRIEFSLGQMRADGDSSDPAPDLLTALEKQLGLKLEKSKTQLDVVVVDRFDKEPVGN